MSKKIVFAMAFVVLTLPVVASAETGDRSTSTRFETPKAIIQTAIKNVIARCPIIESKIQVKATNFDNNKVKHLEIYARLKNQLTNIASKLEAKGVDVSVLKADLVILDQKIKKFSEDYAIYIKKLKASQEFVCGKSEGDFRTALKDAKVALAQVHKDTLDIRSYFAQTIKPEINRIKQLINGKKASTTDEQTTSTSDEVIN